MNKRKKKFFKEIFKSPFCNFLEMEIKGIRDKRNRKKKVREERRYIEKKEISNIQIANMCITKNKNVSMSIFEKVKKMEFKTNVCGSLIFSGIEIKRKF